MAHPVATADCVAWYRGDSLVDGGGGVASSWQDKSGNGYHLTPNGSPSIVNSGLNSRLAARLVPASSQYFSRASTPAVSQPFTYAVIAKSDTPADGFRAMLASNTTTYSVLYYEVASGGTVVTCETYAGGGGNAGGTIVPDVWHLHVAIYNGASSDLLADNVSLGTGNPGTDGPNGLRIGTNAAFDGGNQYWDGDIAEAVVWNKALDSTERSALFAYYQSYYSGSAARVFGAVMG